jgi:oxygen-independent coproporphyrinogen-3 oxidase
MFHFTALPPISLYIHVPWCIRKCPYCDFNSHALKNHLPEADYVNALLADLAQDLPKIGERVITTIFIGGGTPSLLSPETLYDLLNGIRAQWPVQANAEITLEVNPGTLDSMRFQGFREIGITRLSLGIQSFNDHALRKLGRIHGRQEALQAIDAVIKADFEHFNLDLMFGLPGQTLESALADLQQAVSVHPPHLSWYQLTIEPNTRFYHAPPHLPTENCIWDIHTAGQHYLAEQGYMPYEISAYAQAVNWQCQHNLNYWQFGDYLGIGAGAHSKITAIHPATITRLNKQRHPWAYLRAAQTTAVITGCHVLTAEEVCLEFMMNALRLNQGFTIPQFVARTGLAFEYITPALERAYQQGWLSRVGEHIYPTETGLCFLNNLLELF